MRSGSPVQERLHRIRHQTVARPVAAADDVAGARGRDARRAADPLKKLRR